MELLRWRAARIRPSRYCNAEVRLRGGAIAMAVYTGFEWLHEGHPIEPEAWRPLRRDRAASDSLVFGSAARLTHHRS